MTFKPFKLMLTLCTALLFASCTGSDEPAAGVDKVTVRYTAQLPGYIDARAVGDGQQANELFFWVFDENSHELEALRLHNIEFDNAGQAVVEVPLTPGHTYSFAFWAQNKNCDTYNPNNANFVDIIYWHENGDDLLSSDDLRDAFFALERDVEVTSGNELVERTVSLRRPFSQLNYGISTEAFQAMAAAGFDLTGAKARVTVSRAYTRFGLLACGPTQMSDNYVDDVVFEMALFPDEMLKSVRYTDPVTGQTAMRDYVWLAFNYFLTTVDQTSLIDTSITIETADGRTLGPFTFNNKAVQGNYRTNIVTDFMIEDVNFNIIIDQNFDDYDNVLNYTY